MTEYITSFKWSEVDEAYIITVPQLPGCMSEGDTVEEALENIEDAIELYLDDMEEGHITPPTPWTLDEWVERNKKGDRK